MVDDFDALENLSTQDEVALLRCAGPVHAGADDDRDTLVANARLGQHLQNGGKKLPVRHRTRDVGDGDGDRLRSPPTDQVDQRRRADRIGQRGRHGLPRVRDGGRILAGQNHRIARKLEVGSLSPVQQLYRSTMIHDSFLQDGVEFNRRTSRPQTSLLRDLHTLRELISWVHTPGPVSDWLPMNQSPRKGVRCGAPLRPSIGQ